MKIIFRMTPAVVLIAWYRCPTQAVSCHIQGWFQLSSLLLGHRCPTQAVSCHVQGWLQLPDIRVQIY